MSITQYPLLISKEDIITLTEEEGECCENY